ncbi:MAG: hypothetical protein QOG15_3734 [Solirubrobacteraceae bacterium]|nr:hypothetical protein [Solirubrobacteraceae bacterium]
MPPATLRRAVSLVTLALKEFAKQAAAADADQPAPGVTR